MKTVSFSAATLVLIAGSAFGSIDAKQAGATAADILAPGSGFTGPVGGEGERVGADQAIINVAGIPSMNALGNAANTVLFVNIGNAPGQSVNGIGWDVTLFADVNVGPFGGSWLSEIAVMVSNSSGQADPNRFILRPGAGVNTSGMQAFSSNGIVKLANVPLPDVVPLADNLIRLEFFETFDDDAAAADGAWVSGTLTLQTKRIIPTPGAAGLLGLAGIALVSRRRR